jgi:hypothetical protein
MFQLKFIPQCNVIWHQLTLTLSFSLIHDTGLTAAAGNNCSINRSALSIEYTPLMRCCCSCLLLLLPLVLFITLLFVLVVDVAAVLVLVSIHSCTLRSATAAHHLQEHKQQQDGRLHYCLLLFETTCAAAVSTITQHARKTCSSIFS